LCARSLRLPTLRAFQFSQLDVVNNADGFDTYITATGCSTATETATVTTTTVTQTTTGSECEGLGYGSSLVNKRGKNSFRIAFERGLSLEQCLDECTAAANSKRKKGKKTCAGVSYEVGLSFFFCVGF
jgi:hypothetical protein